MPTKKPMLSDRIRDVEWLPYKKWSKIHPHYSQWLKDNGFRYFKFLDKGRERKTEDKI